MNPLRRPLLARNDYLGGGALIALGLLQIFYAGDALHGIFTFWAGIAFLFLAASITMSARCAWIVGRQQFADAMYAASAKGENLGEAISWELASDEELWMSTSPLVNQWLANLDADDED